MFLFVNSLEEMQGKVKLDGKQYVEAYGDKNSPEYNTLADDFCKKVCVIH